MTDDRLTYITIMRKQTEALKPALALLRARVQETAALWRKYNG